MSQAKYQGRYKEYDRAYNASPKARAARRRWREAHLEEEARRQREYRLRNGEVGKMAERRTDLRRMYGITLEEYDRMFEEQDGVCAICGRTNGNKRLGVDHDHATGAVRGLLCHSCNVALGLLGDDIERVAAMLEYLS